MTRIHQTAVAMVGIFAQTDVGNNCELRMRLPYGFNRLLNDSLRVEILRSNRVLDLRDPEQHQGLNAERGRRLHFWKQSIDGPLVDARHRRDFDLLVRPMPDEDRKD